MHIGFRCLSIYPYTILLFDLMPDNAWWGDDRGTLSDETAHPYSLGQGREEGEQYGK